ncbi:Acyl carrier protein 3, mitochondrial, partial [Mucuna pruriens]
FLKYAKHKEIYVESCQPKDGSLPVICWCSSTSVSSDLILDRVIRLVKKYDKIDAKKKFSIEIPDEKADKLTCCADLANNTASGANQKIMDKP